MGVRGATFPFMPGRLYWTTRSLDLRSLARRFTMTLAAYFGTVVLFFTGFAVFFAPLPVYLADRGFTASAIFGLYLLASLGSAALFVTVGRLAQRYDVALLQTGGLVTRAITLPAVAFVGAAFAATAVGLITTAVLFAVIGITWAVIAVTASTLVTRLAPTTTRGEALGVFAALASFAGGVGSILGGVLASLGYTLGFGVAGVLVLAGAAIVFVLRARTGGTASHRWGDVHPAW